MTSYTKLSKSQNCKMTVFGESHTGKKVLELFYI
jgi:hypothetical protein